MTPSDRSGPSDDLDDDFFDDETSLAAATAISPAPTDMPDDGLDNDDTTLARTDDIMIVDDFADDFDLDATTVMPKRADVGVVDLSDPFYDDETRLARPNSHAGTDSVDPSVTPDPELARAMGLEPGQGLGSDFAKAFGDDHHFDDNFDDDDTAPRGFGGEPTRSPPATAEPANTTAESTSDQGWNPPARPRPPGAEASPLAERTLPMQVVAPLIIALVLVIIIMAIMLNRGGETGPDGNSNSNIEQLEDQGESDSGADGEQDDG